MAPKVDARLFTPSVSEEGVKFSTLFDYVEFGCMLNNGEFFRLRSADSANIFYKHVLTDNYFPYSKKLSPIEMHFTIYWDGLEKPPNNLMTTKCTHAVIASTPQFIEDINGTFIDIIAIDHPSYWLVTGDAGGGVYKGNVKSAIEQIVKKYCSQISLDFRGKTTDSEHNKWWQNRLKPKAFIRSLLNLSIAFNEYKTPWFIYPDDKKLIIQEQGAVESKHRAHYEYRGFDAGVGATSDILSWEVLATNAYSVSANKTITAGLSATSGTYIDYVNHEKSVLVGDDDTKNKYNPRNIKSASFSKADSDPPPDGDKAVGYGYVPSIPEHSAGELGIKYSEYVSSNAIAAYHDLARGAMCIKFTVLGHHIWSGSEGLGADTISVLQNSPDGVLSFMNGNWIVYGFKHRVYPGAWYTDLYCYRLDWNASGKKVGRRLGNA